MKLSSGTEQVVVVGAGIVGICCAIQLQRAGFVVTLVDKKGIAQECSRGNAGHFATEQVFPLADKALLPKIPSMMLNPLGPISIKLSYLHRIIPWFSQFLFNMLPARFDLNTAALKSLNEVSLPAWEALLQEADLLQYLSKKGSLLTFEKTPVRTIERIRNQFAAQGIAVKTLARDEIKSMVSGISENVNHALFFTDVGHTFDPEQLAFALFDHFSALGGRYIQDEVEEIRQSENKVNVLTANSSLSTEQVVIATGAWSKRLVNALGYKLPLDTERGYHVMLGHQAGLSMPVASYERKMIMTPMLNGLRVAGTVEFAGLNAKANVKRANALRLHAKALLADRVNCESAEAQCWMGMRPSLPDSLPVIGKAPFHERINFAFGHQHLGLTQAAITGQLIAELLSQKQSKVDLKPFCISRFS